MNRLRASTDIADPKETLARNKPLCVIGNAVKSCSEVRAIVRIGLIDRRLLAVAFARVDGHLGGT